jgi:hypothetical protein
VVTHTHTHTQQKKAKLSFRAENAKNVNKNHADARNGQNSEMPSKNREMTKVRDTPFRFLLATKVIYNCTQNPDACP